MFPRTLTFAVAGAFVLASVAPSLAQRRTTKCSSILSVCMQRAGQQSMICDGMYQRAIQTGQWEETQEPDGTKHPAVPCTK